ncbi:hypothetical protein SCLCIDRAFT_26461 [Scleroderma citrinum Foug A]|uniref:Heterokaryon incompatibility domain-containing protein n=1 Tax=Scleroderma citrinum Foug A TaxID=1036808 RepID=A0A0C3DXE6_9AGAM|nr:hypothetical protein SCLCIDRAFT_26461 [Scleroderma citrinum Foug A]
MTNLDDRITRNRKILERHPPGNTGRAVALCSLAASLRSNFLQTDDTLGLEEAIALLRSSLDLLPTGHSDRSDSLHGLALCFNYRYYKQGTIADLQEAITFGRAALELRSQGHSRRAMTHYNLAIYLSDRFLELDTENDLDDAILLHRSASNLCPASHSDRSSLLHSLALCFYYRYYKQGATADLQEAIKFGQAALELRPQGHSHRDLTRYNLAVYLSDRFLKLGTVCDLNEAILLHRSALDLRPAGHSDRSDSLHSLALCFNYRYNRQCIMTDLEGAIKFGRAALELRSQGHSCRALTLFNLAISLSDRFRELGTDCDLDEAILLHRSALDLCPAGHPDRSDSLHGLARCCSRDRHSKQGAMVDFKETVPLGRALLELCFPTHSDRASTLYSFATHLSHRFLTLDTDCDLDEAISLHQSAPDLGHSDWLGFLNQLANSLSSRFVKLEAPADLDELISPAVLYWIFIHRAIMLTLGLSTSCFLSSESEFRDHPANPGVLAVPHTFTTLLPTSTLGSANLKNISDVQDAHPDHAVSLHKLLIYVKDLADDVDVAQVVDRIVAIARAALKSCPTGHPDHVVSLTTLATFLLHRFQQRGDVANADEAIVLYLEVLELCPSGTLASASHLHDLAQYLLKKFTKLAVSTDLDDAIKFEQVALALFPQGHPDHTVALNNLFNYRQLKIGRVASTRSARPTGITPGSRLKYLIEPIILDVLKKIPPRLLDLRTGKLCDRDSQITQFEQSGEYNQLLSSASTMDALAPDTTHIREVVSTYFRYVTLSHRWGRFEPLLRDIDGRDIYNLDPTDGISKLQSFCQQCCRRGYLWGWSDTCCIDKESSTELQEAIGSMFSWYQQSALTLVHLADVSGMGRLASSVWFKRGWTLQELLAPRTMLFFTQDWLLYRDGSSSNHKEDSAILGELEQATGITSRHLADFDPGVRGDARSRLQWASTRCTTRPEDMAYSLLGVFSLYIPILYGEPAEHALGRLLAKVISMSGDTSILDWVGQSSAFHSCFPATVAPYQNPLLSTPDLTTPPFTRRIRELFSLAAHKMQQAFSKLPLAKFANFRLILPCIVHRIKAMTLTRVDINTATHFYQIQAMGLAPIDIAPSERLENAAKGVSYVLIRPLHPDLLHRVIDTDDAGTHQLFTWLEQPFSIRKLTKYFF